MNTLRPLALIAALLWSVPALAWVPTGHFYPGGTIAFRTGDVCDLARFASTPGDCSGDASNPDWETEFVTAGSRWNTATDLFDVTFEAGQGSAVAGVCNSNDPNSVFFLPTQCNTPGNPNPPPDWGASTLAIARTYSITGGEAFHSDIIFNSTKTWGAFDGPLASNPGVNDFRRVAVHEAGHVLGLNHPPHTQAIMYFAQQDVTGPGADDLNGVAAIYGLLSHAVSVDTSGNSVQELVAVRTGQDGSITAEVRDGDSGSLLRSMSFLSNGFRPVDAVVLPDLDSNGRPELALLAARKSDGRALVEIRNLAGAEAPRVVWFAAGVTPLKMVSVDDADGNGVTELAVLSVRDSDGRALVEVKNAFGATLPNTVWFMDFATPIDIATVPDADKNGVPEVAVLLARYQDGRGVVEVKNASGPTAPNAVWATSGVTVKALAVVDDADANTVPEVAIASTRNSDGRILVEVKNAAGATNPNTVWFAAGQRFDQLLALPDVDGNSVAELALLSRRISDGRILVEVKNADGATNPNSVWFPAGFAPGGSIALLDDADGNSVPELAVMLSRHSDGRLAIEERNARGAMAPRTVWLTP